MVWPDLGCERTRSLASLLSCVRDFADLLQPQQAASMLAGFAGPGSPLWKRLRYLLMWLNGLARFGRVPKMGSMPDRTRPPQARITDKTLQPISTDFERIWRGKAQKMRRSPSEITAIVDEDGGRGNVHRILDKGRTVPRRRTVTIHGRDGRRFDCNMGWGV